MSLDKRTISTVLNTAYVSSEAPPEPAKTVAEATRRVTEEARLMVEQANGRRPVFNRTLADIVERM